jgi:hypothetical protein
MTYSADADGLNFTLPPGSTLYLLFTDYALTIEKTKSEFDRLARIKLPAVAYKRSDIVKKLLGPLQPFQDKPWTYVVAIHNPTALPVSGGFAAEPIAAVEGVGITKVIDDSAMRSSVPLFAFAAGLGAILLLKGVRS